MKQTIKCLVAAFAAMLMSVAAFAQVTTAALGGRVVEDRKSTRLNSSHA